MKNVGRIVRIVGAVVDCEFAADSIPAIYNALTVDARHSSRSHFDRARGPDAPAGRYGPHGRHDAARTAFSAAPRSLTPALPSRCPSATRPSVASGTSSASRSTASRCPRSSRPIRFTVRHPPSTSSPPRPRPSRPASRSSTFSSPTFVVARRACSAAPASARPFSSWSSSTTSPRSTTVPPCSRASASVPVRARTSTSR